MSWQTLKSEHIVKNKWLSLRKDHVKLPSGVELDDFYVIERPNIVHVIAITEDEKFILEKQYRYAINQECFEICAGLIESGETPLQAAKRELYEETGYSGGEWTDYGIIYIDPSNKTDLSYTFVVRGVVKTDVQHLEKSESIEIHLLSKEDVLNMMQTGKIISGLMLAPLWKYMSENKK